VRVSLRWHPWTGPGGQHGIATSLPYDQTDGVNVEPTLRIVIDEHTGGGTGWVILDIRVEVGGLWTRETTSHKSVDEALAHLGDGWRPAVQRAQVAHAAWEACP
jgi:hypothetical protein